METGLKSYDYAFAGGGAAGLSLALAMLQSPLSQGSYAIIDPDRKARNDRTFAFWTDTETAYEPFLSRSWSKLRFVTDEYDQVFDLAPYRYCMLPALAFYRHAHSVLRSHPQVDFLSARVSRIDNREEEAWVWIEEKPVAARWAFDSRFPMKSYQQECDRASRHSPGNVNLIQRFHGWFVETEKAAFETEVATLFDFRVPQEGDLRFCYVLPFDERRALVELVSLQRLKPEPILADYLRRVCRVNRYQVLSTECGASPLTDRPFPRQLGSRTLAIGVLGGQIKPSSGYAFTRMQADAEAIVASLLEENHPFRLPGSSPAFRLCDALLLEVMQRHTSQMEQVFKAMFRGNSPQSIFQFLDECASGLDIVRLALSLPPGVFLDALWQRVWTGRRPADAVLRRLSDLTNRF